MIKSKKLILFF